MTGDALPEASLRRVGALADAAGRVWFVVPITASALSLGRVRRSVASTTLETSP